MQEYETTSGLFHAFNDAVREREQGLGSKEAPKL
jgi:hypothetical protein